MEDQQKGNRKTAWTIPHEGRHEYTKRRRGERPTVIKVTRGYHSINMSTPKEDTVLSKEQDSIEDHPPMSILRTVEKKGECNEE